MTSRENTSDGRPLILSLFARPDPLTAEAPGTHEHTQTDGADTELCKQSTVKGRGADGATERKHHQWVPLSSVFFYPSSQTTAFVIIGNNSKWIYKVVLKVGSGSLGGVSNLFLKFYQFFPEFKSSDLMCSSAR